MGLDNKTLENLRVAYKMAKLDMSDIKNDPFEQFQVWFDEALKSECDEPNAFTLSTIGNNRPHSRVVLLKGFYQKSPIFYTNYLSQKGHDLESNAFGAINFLWLPLQRQVRIEGKIYKLEAGLSDTYFNKRPRGSQLGAIASPQSEKVADRKTLENLFETAQEKYKDIDPLPRPANWGGYYLVPDYYEFWQGRDNRMHDRLSYQLKSSSWTIERLAP